MYGSQKRIKQTSALAKEFKTAANDTQREIDMLKSANPFESAAAKSAMTTASQNSKQFYNRAMNQLGANASPEAIVAAQGAATAGQSGAAGSIAVGAEANKLNEINALRGLKENQMNTYGATKQSSINQIGTGWKDFFSSLDSIGDLASAVAKPGQIFTAIQGKAAAGVS